jgi:type IV pilus assembly protein PilP
MTKKTRQKNKRFLLAVTLCLFAWAGCSKKETTPPPKQPLPAKSAVPAVAPPAVQVQKPVTSARPPVQPQKPAVQGQISSARAVSPPSVTLNFSGKKDPFKPFIVPQAEQKKAPPEPLTRKARGELLPIQSFETEKFRVSGIIVGLRENSALVLDPTGKGYVLKEGMQIGSNDGVVSRITPSTVEVVEKFRADSSRIKTRTIKLTLVRKGKESPR